ncbi:MAG: hypothetical protein GEU93_08270 [Propionibacteriales bacterium]|nr:hypothetical protein [Propionibacteriales bacterium]
MATYRHYDELDGHLTDELLDDRIVEQLLAGRLSGERPDLQELSVFVTALHSMPTTLPTVVRPELAAIFETGLAPGNGELSPVVADQPIRQTPRSRRMLKALSAFVATLAGKAVLGTATVAVGVGGAHAAGVVDVPGLPDRAPATVVDAPADDTDTPEQGDDRSGRPADPGVDGGSVSERSTSGEPQEDGKAFGTSVAEEATDGTPAEDVANQGDAAQDQQPDTPAPGADIADQHRPDTAGGADAADDHRPDDPPVGRP